MGVCSGKLHQHTVNFPECCWEYTNFLMPDLQPVSGVRYMRYLRPGVPPTVHMVLEYHTPEYVPWSSSVGIISTVNSASR